MSPRLAASLPALAALAALARPARAGDELPAPPPPAAQPAPASRAAGDPHAAQPAPASRAAGDPHAAQPAPAPRAAGDPPAALADQLAGEAAAIDGALAMVAARLAAADRARGLRLAAAYRVLQAPVAGGALATARRRAAARWLVERDRAERGLLADEAGQLRAAAERTAASATRIPEIVLPETIARPAAGELVRRFGTLVHERSKATLARRGVDLEVEPRAPVIAPERGTVRYAGPIRGLDAGLIIDHGSYYTVVAKLGELSVPVGAPVERGDRIGRAARHRVYLELRIKLGSGGIPVDPEPMFEPPR